MSFLLWVLQAFSNALVNIFWKKSMDVAPNISEGLFFLYGELVGLLFVMYFMILWKMNYHIFADFKALFLVFMAVFLSMISYFMKQNILKVNKVSTLLPFDNLAPLFTIFFWYLLFKDVSIYSFFMAVLTVMLVILFSLDYKNLKLPKKVWLLLFQQFLFAVFSILLAFVLKVYNSVSVATLDALFSILILMIFTMKNSELKQFHSQPKDFYKFSFGAGLFWRVAYMISLFLISDMGIVLSTLLSFLTLGMTLIFGYFYLDDKPSKKDMILAVLVSLLVGLGLYLK